ncbi:MAG TPA: hypothetical protein VIQ24_07145 [Pyrinomonadaceae bacterium]
MRVIPIDSKLPFKFRGPRVKDRLPEGAKLLAGAALTFWGPPLLYSVIIDNALPFFVMFCNQALGILLGILIHRNQSGDNLSCVPANYIPNVACAARPYKLKKVA